MRNSNKSPQRLIHSSQSYDKKFNKKRIEYRKENLYRDIFFLDEVKEEEDSEEDINSEINIIILYNKEKIITKFNQNKTFNDFIKFLEKKYFRVGFEENYEIYYDNKQILMNDKRKINKIVNTTDKDKEIKFTLKSIKKAFLNTKLNRIYIQLENIPSFMDLSEQIYNFINSQKEEINYDINYKDNSCRILFGSQEIAFSFVTYMTNIKFTNKYYRKLKIDIKYNPLNATKNRDNKLRFMSEENKFNNINKTIDSLNNNTINPLSTSNNIREYKSYNKLNNKIYYYENTYENDYYEDNYKSIRGSSPYEYEKELEKQKRIKDKKNWIGNNDFFTSVNKKSFNKLLRPKKRLFLKKIDLKEVSGLNSLRNRIEKNNDTDNIKKYSKFKSSKY